MISRSGWGLAEWINPPSCWLISYTLPVNRSYVRCLLRILVMCKSKAKAGRLSWTTTRCYRCWWWWWWMMMHWWWSISSCCLFVIRGWWTGISVLPLKWVWEPKKACDERFRAVCVFSPKRCLRLGTSTSFRKKDTDKSAHNPLLYVKTAQSVYILVLRS